MRVPEHGLLSGGPAFDLNQAPEASSEHAQREMRDMTRGSSLWLVIVGAALAATAGAADFERGKLLYNARCVGCHDKSVHNREARKALTIEGIRAQVRRWDAFTGGAWREDEVNDVTSYLNELFYRYPCPPAVCPDKKATLGSPEPHALLSIKAGKREAGMVHSSAPPLADAAPALAREPRVGFR
jgi:mono/diheme cytochrome c family protein